MKKDPKETKIKDIPCRTVRLSATELNEIKLDDYGFYKFITKHQKDSLQGKSFKVILPAPMVYDTFDDLLNQEEWIDDCDISTYYKSSSHQGAYKKCDVTDFQFELKVHKSARFNKQVKEKLRSTTPGIYCVLYKLIQMQKVQKKLKKKTSTPVTVELTINNIRRLGHKLSKSINPKGTISEESTLADVDDLVNEISKAYTVNVLNVGALPDLVRNIGHPFYPEHLKTPFGALRGKASRTLGVTLPYIYFSSKFSNTPIHIEDDSLGSENVNIGPGDNLWWLIEAKYLDKLNCALQKEFKDDTNCPSFIRSKAYFLTCQWLDQNEIPYTLTIQKPSEIMITPANSAHQVVCLTESFKHTVNFPCPKWMSLAHDEMYICPGHIYADTSQKWRHGSKPLKLGMLRMRQNWGNCNKNRYNDTSLGITVETADDLKDQQSTADLKYKCKDCKRCFASTYSLNRHLLNVHKMEVIPAKPKHRKQPRVSCTVCKSELLNAFTLKRHMKTIHQIETNTPVKKLPKYKTVAQQCNICQKTLSSQGILNRHIRSIHSNNKGQYSCHYCHYTAKQRSDLKEHILLKRCKISQLQENNSRNEIQHTASNEYECISELEDSEESVESSDSD